MENISSLEFPPGALFQPTKSLDFGNSGTGIRLLSGIIASNNIKAKLIGDKSLSARPMRRVTDHLKKIGAIIKLRKNFFSTNKYSRSW